MIGSAFDVRHYSGDAETHAHGHHQLVLPLRGRLDMEVEGRCNDVTAAPAAVVAAGQQHSFSGSRDNAFLILDLAHEGDLGGDLHRPFWHETLARPFVEIDPALGRFCHFLAEEVTAFGLTGLHSDAVAESLIGALERRSGVPQVPESRALAAAKNYIQSHYLEPLSVAQVAAESGLSVSRLHRLFQSSYGSSPKRYITACRLRHAARLLASGGLPLADIALQCGYADQSAFTRAFRRDYKVTPARYRATARQAAQN